MTRHGTAGCHITRGDSKPLALSVGVPTGYETMLMRNALGLDKDHDIDVYCIAIQGIIDMTSTALDTGHMFPDTYEVKQFQRHERAIIHHQTERTYRLDGRAVAKNRHKHAEQKEPSLEEWFVERVGFCGCEETVYMCSKLSTTKSRRYYNDTDRIMPGAIFMYGGKRYVLSGQLSNGAYYQAYGCGSRNFPACGCTILRRNTGLVCV